MCQVVTQPGCETADTDTIGVVLTPSFIEGLTISVDYWDVAIEDAISAVGAGDILKGCYDSTNYPNLGFCNVHTSCGWWFELP